MPACPGAPPCSQMWPECLCSQKRSRVLVSISSITQTIAVSWSCPCASVSLCWYQGGSERSHVKANLGIEGCMLVPKSPHYSCGKTSWLCPKFMADNLLQSRNCCREDGVGIQAPGGQSSASAYTGKCCSQHRQLPCSWYLALGRDPTHCLVPQSRQEGKASLTCWGR